MIVLLWHMHGPIENKDSSLIFICELSNWDNRKKILEECLRRISGRKLQKFCSCHHFWNSVVYTLKVMAPLVRVLHLMDGEIKSAMSYTYGEMDKEK
ncbi:hypothetical protein CR513_09161, partial [Mucuna pruriens]